MLSKLFGTNARVKILKQTLLHPDTRFSAKRLAKKLKITVASIKKEMENLEKFGLLISFDSLIATEGKKREELNTKVADKKEKLAKSKTKKKVKKTQVPEKVYAINTSFVLYKEIKTLIMKSQILYEKDFIEKIEKLGKLKLLIFAGFFVNDTASDVDLFIVGDFNKGSLVKIVNELENDLGREVNYTIMSEKEYKYRKDVTDVFLYGILEGQKMVSVDSFEKNIERKP